MEPKPDYKERPRKEIDRDRKPAPPRGSSIHEDRGNKKSRASKSRGKKTELISQTASLQEEGNA